MPKVGMEPVRRKALVDATLKAVGDHGSLAVTMSEIARHAGVSPALAHHYFGSKEQLLIATIRSLLQQLRTDVVKAIQSVQTPRERLSAIIRVSFQADQFAPETIAAWLAFYADSQRSEETRRLLVLYARRLRSNLVANLRQLCPVDDALRIADGAAAMIDGLYIRQSLRSVPISIDSSIALTEDYLNAQLRSVDSASLTAPPPAGTFSPQAGKGTGTALTVCEKDGSEAPGRGEQVTPDATVSVAGSPPPAASRRPPPSRGR
ncbi:TetR/AcrR family transcriptional repressor of bet genes [Mycoplana sp. BE70]|nr:TetR/AcrR family transcriptional repressor of bet genes [Mycoplana sp. BE70]